MHRPYTDTPTTSEAIPVTKMVTPTLDKTTPTENVNQEMGEKIKKKAKKNKKMSVREMVS